VWFRLWISHTLQTSTPTKSEWDTLREKGKRGEWKKKKIKDPKWLWERNFWRESFKGNSRKREREGIGSACCVYEASPCHLPRKKLGWMHNWYGTYKHPSALHTHSFSPLFLSKCRRLNDAVRRTWRLLLVCKCVCVFVREWERERECVCFKRTLSWFS